ncbi:MAG: hypothetical protein HKP40_13380 [Litoreibacter sp.]|nr:hypothetical protein [Litoreibacter sp.]
MKQLSALVLGSLTMALASTFAGHAQSTPRMADEVVQVSLIPGWRQSEDLHITALRIVLAPGWKTYWRAPGDSGIPTQLSWRGSQNVAAAQIQWPRPEIFHSFGMRSIGYRGEVVLPIMIRTKNPGDISAEAKITLGVCQEICMPLSFRLSADLPRAVTRTNTDISAALKARPLTAKEAGVTGTSCSIAPRDRGLDLSVAMTIPRLPGRDEVAVIETGDSSVWVSEPRLRRSGNTVVADAQLIPQDQAFAFSRSDIRVTLLTSETAVEIQGCSGG